MHIIHCISTKCSRSQGFTHSGEGHELGFLWLGRGGRLPNYPILGQNSCEDSVDCLFLKKSRNVHFTVVLKKLNPMIIFRDYFQ